MRSTLCLLVLSMSFFACGGDPGAVPTTPSVSVPEAGAPSAPATPAAPAAPDAGLKK